MTQAQWYLLVIGGLSVCMFTVPAVSALVDVYLERREQRRRTLPRLRTVSGGASSSCLVTAVRPQTVSQ